MEASMVEDQSLMENLSAENAFRTDSSGAYASFLRLRGTCASCVRQHPTETAKVPVTWQPIQLAALDSEATRSHMAEYSK
jgi:hypothetical protein